MTQNLLADMDASEIAAKVAERMLRVTDLADRMLELISAVDPKLNAFVHVDRGLLLAEAAELDSEAASGKLRGPLHGVPIGVKDIYHVAGMPTRAGSRLLVDAGIAETDSAAVSALRAAGALIAGKTATTEFAYAEPAPTLNPWNLDHEPGGSSSGSAAAVAAGLVPAALGSQTAGSVLRPAAFCGVVGFKPSFGRIDRTGVIPFAWSLDTMGTLTRSVRDARLLLDVMTIPGWVPTPARLDGGAPRVGYVPRLLADKQSPGMSRALRHAATAFERAGATVAEVDLPGDFAAAVDAHQVIMVVEGAASHADSFAERGDRYGTRMRQLVETGSVVRGVDYLRAQRVRRDLFECVTPLFNRFDVLLVPAAPGSAPLKAAGFTGDPAFNAPWTMFGLPAITLFGGLDANGMPLGVQLVGPAGADETLLDAAAWCERILGPAPRPRL